MGRSGRVRQPAQLLGESPDRLTLAERERYAGWWIALEIYSPNTLPMRLIEALGRTTGECLAQLGARGANASGFEFVQLRHT